MGAAARQLQHGRAGGGLTNPLRPLNPASQEFEQGLEKLKRSFIHPLTPPPTPDPMALLKPENLGNVNFLYAYHGTGAETARRVASSGPRPLRSTDGGFFGAGPYVALEASYAARYAEIDPPDGTTGHHAMVLFVAVVGSSYVVTRKQDYPNRNYPQGPSNEHSWSNFYSDDPKRSIALLGNYDSHFIPVRYVDSTYDYQACSAKDGDCAGHELVVQGFQQLCPVALLHFSTTRP